MDLNVALQRHVNIVHDHEAFWNQQGRYDIVHLHFPEYMTFETEQALRGSLTRKLMSAVEERLQYWSGRSKLVITRHVLLPHGARSDPRWERMYEMVYRYVDGVVHFADPSVEDFERRYANTRFVHGVPLHAVVPHHNYASLPNTISREQARRALRIPDRAKVLLVFGAIRSEEERQMVLDAFHDARLPHKLLLVSRWREKLADVSWIRLKYWLRDLKRLYYRVHPRYHFNYEFVAEENAQTYLNAADVLLIPRLHVLNSGNITLGMTFGRVVIGPDSLDVGDLLRSTGNVVFDPNHPESAAAAVEQAFALAARNEVGPANMKLALGEWSAEQCADRYFEFFEKLNGMRKTA
ncbi:hypothetical protein [Elongatibacter sediminis]|uniref:Glycosyltransferase n=1 Tax=Elongatibacter sediminis TaxID=3119006 RepID=A0AAW9RBE5_9GAMM